MNNRKIRKETGGFTLVEMIVVLLVMSIMMAATVWGVTGWIQHFTYIRNEETARYIYLGAQSGLSDQAKRGTLDKLIEDIKNGAGGDSVVVTSAEKAGFGLPTEKDLHEEEHEYAYLKVDKGGIEANSTLAKLVTPYLSEAETLDGSVVLELDLTAKKVYSVFYSTWATKFLYASGTNEVRKEFNIFKTDARDTRNAGERSSFCVGYYGTDQVNVARIEAAEQIVDVEAMLFNDETLHLDFHANIDNPDYAEYTIDFFKKGGDKPVFTVVLDPGDTQMIGPLGTAEIEPTPKKLLVRKPDGTELGKYTFYVGYKKSDIPKKNSTDPDRMDVTLLLDQQIDSLSLALMEDQTEDPTLTDMDGLSITRFMGKEAAIVYAKVKMQTSSRAGGVVNCTGSVESNKENDLFKTDTDNTIPDEDKTAVTHGKYGICYNRHLYNVRFAEEEKGTSTAEYTYTFWDDLYFNESEIYSVLSSGYSKEENTKKVFATLPKLSETSRLEGNGFSIYDLKMDTTSHVEYERDADGQLVTNSATKNIATAAGLVAENSGLIRRLVLRGAKAEFLTKSEYTTKIQGQGANPKNNFPIADDNLQAIGILCGRSNGSLQEIYLDDECELKATVFPTETPKKDPGCGIGMIAGTIKLSAKDKATSAQLIDRIRTGGKLTAALGTDFTKVGASVKISDEGRGRIFDNVTDGRYAYGIGGVFGYAYEDFSKVTDLTADDTKVPAVGASEKTITEKKGKARTDIDGYFDKGYSGSLAEDDDNVRNAIAILKPQNRGKDDPQLTLTQRAENGVKNVFENWTWSIENRTTVNTEQNPGNGTFIGGILGNAEVVLKDPTIVTQEDAEKDYTIPTNFLIPQIIGCKNYGDVYGEDYIGGIIGINHYYGYLKDCASFSSMKAAKGIAGGITSENFGFIEESLVDREKEDKPESEGFAPRIVGNEEVVGTIASINYHSGVLKECKCAIAEDADVSKAATKNIMIIGNDMRTMGYLVGMNYGVVDSGIVGSHMDYSTQKDSITIGGIVGVNYSNGLVKNIESDMKLRLTNAELLGGVTGLNHGEMKKCFFSGDLGHADTGINTDKLRVGGIAAVNKLQSEGAKKPSIHDCYVAGAKIKMRGVANFTEDTSADKKVGGSSAVGGVCGHNYPGCEILNCYVTARYDTDANGNFIWNTTKNDYDFTASELTVENGMVGGIAGINQGDLFHCGYTQRKLKLREDLKKVNAASTGGAGTVVSLGGFVSTETDMEFADKAMQYLEIAADSSAYGYYATEDATSDWDGARLSLESGLTYAYEADKTGTNAKRERTAAAAESLRVQFMRGMTGDLNETASKWCGSLSDKADQGKNALPKKTGPNQKDAYQELNNTFLICMDQGKGYLGGIAGYNTLSGSVLYCSTGRWVVESYYPSEIYDAIGGIVGENASNGVPATDAKRAGDFRFNVNLAYVRREMPYVSTSSSQAEREKHAFSYVGGVVGTQKNESTSDWVMQGCLNAGKVVYMYGNNVGGIIAKLMKNGGTIKNCYNFGILMSGFSDNNNYSHFDGQKIGGYIGTAGGIVAHMTELNTDQAITIESCANHSVVNMPANGLNRKTGVATSTEVRYSGNDVGGVAGQLSSPKDDRYYALNIKDCINGWGAEVYTHSTSGGILGRIGGLSSYNESKTIAETVNNAVVNISGCRNYSSDFWQFTDSAGAGKKRTFYNRQGGTGNIFGVRPVYVGKTHTGYTSIQACLGLRINDFGDGGNYINDDNIGKIAGYRCNNNDLPSYQCYDLCANNYYIDNYSFQYLDPDVDVSTGRSYFSDSVTGDARLVSTMVNGEKKSNPQKGNAYGYYSNKQNLLDTALPGESYPLHPDSLKPDNKNDKAVDAARLYAISVNNDDSHAFVSEDYGYQVKSANIQNAWIEPNTPEGQQSDKTRDVLKTLVLNEGEKVVGPVVAHFDEKGIDESIANLTGTDVNHFDFRDLFEQGTRKQSRIPFADEYDFDAEAAFRLDRDYMDFVDWINKEQKWDRIINVNVKEDQEEGRYFTSWDLQALAPEKSVSATEFQMRITVYELPEGQTTFSKTAYDNGDYNAYIIDEPYYQKAYSRSTTFTLPERITEKLDLEHGKQYFAVVIVRDIRDKNWDDCSTVMDTAKIKSWIMIKPKLPQPEFEIVANGDTWMLHLTNPGDYEKYKNITGLKIGAYRKDSNGKKLPESDIYLEGSELRFDTESDLPLLYNAKELSLSDLVLNVKDEEIYVYATAETDTATYALASDPKTMTVYIPERSNPNIIFDKGEGTVENGENGRPSYQTTLTYSLYDSENPTYQPPVPQIFRVELYGIKKENGVAVCHETIAYKEYELTPGSGEASKASVNIGYYDAEGCAKLSDYDDFDVEIWYASPGQGDVYNYFEVPQYLAEQNKLRSTGFITDKSGAKTKYLHYTAPLVHPEFEIVAYGDDWYLHLKNAKDYELIKTYGGFKVGAYMLNSTGIKEHEVAMNASDLTDPESGLNANMKLLENGYLDNTEDKEIYFFAKADGYYTRTEKVTTYIPKVTNPEDMSYGFVQDASYSDQLNTEGSFSATLKYDSYGSDKTGEALQPTGDLKQKFVVEVYGTVSENNAQKTLYWDDSIELAPGETTQISITKSDLEQSGEDLSQYSNLEAVVWYAGTGRGPVYTYFSVPTSLAEAHPQRISGYINRATDTGAMGYYHPPILDPPEIEFVRLDRSGSWYARLLNADAYEGIEAQTKVLLGNNEFTPDTYADGLLKGAAKVDTTELSGVLKAYTSADGYFVSKPKNYGQIELFPSLDATNAQLLSLENEKMTISDTGSMHYEGLLHFDTAASGEHDNYIRWELYANKAGGKKVTMAMSDDILLQKSDARAGGVGIPLDITVSENSVGVDVTEYEGFTLAAWYSKSVLPNTDTTTPEPPVFKQYFEIEDASLASGKDRAQGVLTQISGSDDTITASDPKYYFVAPLADQANYETGNKLYMESGMGIPKIAEVTGESRGFATWTTEDDKGPDDYNVNLTYYQVDKGVTFDTVEDLTLGGTMIAERQESHVEEKKLWIPKPADEDYRNGWTSINSDLYDYYVVAQPYSSNIIITDPDSSKAQILLATYSKKGIATLVDDTFPIPDLEICYLPYDGNANSKSWFLHLKNAKDFLQDDGTAIAEGLRIYVSIYGKEIVLDPTQAVLDPTRDLKATNPVNPRDITAGFNNSPYINHIPYVWKVPTHTGNTDGKMVFKVTSNLKEGIEREKEIYLPPSGDEKMPNSQIKLTDASYTISGNTINVQGSMQYTVTGTHTGMPHRFGLVYAIAQKDRPTRILARTDEASELRVIPGGDAVSLAMSLQIPDHASAEDIQNARLYVFLMENNYDDPDHTVKHITEFTETYSEASAGRQYLLRDLTSSTDHTQERAYVSIPLNLPLNTSLQNDYATGLRQFITKAATP